MIDAMAAVKPPLSSQEATDRCRNLSYPTNVGQKPLHTFSWTGNGMRTFRLPFETYPRCSADYPEKKGACEGEHHMHGNKDFLVCCLCGWQWSNERSELLSILLTYFTAKLLEDELGF